VKVEKRGASLSLHEGKKGGGDPNRRSLREREKGTLAAFKLMLSLEFWVGDRKCTATALGRGKEGNTPSTIPSVEREKPYLPIFPATTWRRRKGKGEKRG